MSDPGSVIVWFRQDLRLADNPALQAAVRHGGPVIPLFIWVPDDEGRWPPGAASRWWLHQSLAQLDAALRNFGSRLILRSEPSLAVLRDVIAQTRATAVYWNRRYEPAAIERDAMIEAALQRDGIAVECFNGSLLFEPWAVKTKLGAPYRVFTPFWKACLAGPMPESPHAAPTHLNAPARWPVSLKLVKLALEPAIDWAGGMRSAWQPGEAGAVKLLERFLTGALAGYSEKRNHPDRPGTSRLSPHIHFGEISVRQVWAALERGTPLCGSRRVYAAELGWREFAHHLLFHFPHTPQKPLRKFFARFPWQRDRKLLRAWQRGRTGFPIVDAGLRELWHTGWMNNRVRMIAASFLVKDLRISWTAGADWFWDTLVDADLANNTHGWQWTAGCGADAVPYFRIFNPITQGEKFDPDGVYIRQWIPELHNLPNTWIHKPWQAKAEVLADAGIELGRTYPLPIVDHQIARTRALAAFRKIKD